MTKFSTSPMQLALAQAVKAAEADEVPVGAVVTDADGNLIAAAHNLVETRKDVCAHAEILAVQASARMLGKKFLDDYDLYVTLEPCPMCAAAIAQARIRRVYFGAYDPKSGGVEHGPKIFASSSCHHTPEVYGGIMESECSALLKDFFASKR